MVPQTPMSTEKEFSSFSYGEYVDHCVKKRGLLFILLLIVVEIPSAFAFDPDAPPETRIELAPFLTFGGNIALTYELEKNSDLDDSQDIDVSTLEPGLSLALSFDPSSNVQMFLNAELTGELEWAEGEKDRRLVKLELKEAFLLFKNLGDDQLFLQIGRQRFEDDRQWLYDEELDAVGVFYLFSKLSLEFSMSRLDLVARDFLNDESREQINNYFVYGNYTLGEEGEMAAYVLVRHDQSEEQESPIFFGFHSSGEILDDFDYWFELAHVRGRNGSNKIRGIGFDVGSTYVLDLPLEPSMSFGYAFGTGDDNPDDGVDKSFRQTGLQENEGEFNGVPSFKYYGELFDPELSNLSILTGGIGIKFTEGSSIDLVYHYYLQHKASASLRDVRIDIDPDGSSRSLGSEIDLIVGFEEIQNVELKLSLGYFIPGRAFPDGSDSSFLANFEIQYSF